MIDNMSWLFAIGVAVGMSDDHEGTAGLAGPVSWLVITTLLSSGTVAVLSRWQQILHLPRFRTSLSVLSPVSSVLPATTSLREPVFRTHWHSSPASVSFPLQLAVVSIIAAAILFFIWPMVYGALVTVGESIVWIRRSRRWHLCILKPSADSNWYASCIKLCILV